MSHLWGHIILNNERTPVTCLGYFFESQWEPRKRNGCLSVFLSPTSGKKSKTQCWITDVPHLPSIRAAFWAPLPTTFFFEKMTIWGSRINRTIYQRPWHCEELKRVWGGLEKMHSWFYRLCETEDVNLWLLKPSHLCLKERRHHWGLWNVPVFNLSETDFGN